MKIDMDLIRKYDVPGPRYTSYPTAPHFRGDIGGEALGEAMARGLSDGTRGLSLYYHIPFCDSLCYFCGCTTTVTRDRARVEAYLADLELEMDLYLRRLAGGRTVEQLHFGGGTPTHLDPGQLGRLGKAIHGRFSFDEDAEVSCEIDPRELTEDHILALRDIGFNRMSLGVQDFDERVQRSVNRIQSEELIDEVVSWIRGAGIGSLNLDLIYGLPYQDRASFRRTLEKVMAYSPDRLAVFNYAHVPWIKPHQKLIPEAALPAPEVKMDMLKMMIEYLGEQGYVYIGMDHFARQDDELAVAQRERRLQRNFQGYSTRSGLDILAFGMSSISQYRELYLQNVKDLVQYHERLVSGEFPIEKAYIMSDEDLLRQDVIREIMCNLHIDMDEFGRRWGIDFRAHFSEALGQMQGFMDDGLASMDERALAVTDAGRLFLRNIAMLFDAYLKTDKARYSRTV